MTLSEFEEEHPIFEDIVNKKMTDLAEAIQGQASNRSRGGASKGHERKCCTRTGDISDIGVMFRGTIFIDSKSEFDKIDKTRQDDMRRWGYAIFRDFTTEPKMYCSSCGDEIAPEDIDRHLVTQQDEGASRHPQ